MLLDGALSVALSASVAGVVLVTGAEAEDVAAAALALAQRTGLADRLSIVHAEHYADGLSASVRAGIAALPEEANGVLVFLGDMPLVPPGVLAPLVEAVRAGAPAAAPVCGGRRGNPVALSRSLFVDLARVTGDRGARGVLDGLGDRLALIQTENKGVLLDVDTPGDTPP